MLESALAKPRPEVPYTAGGTAHTVHCARNEVESFLVVLNGGVHGLAGVTIDLPAPMAGSAVVIHAAAKYVHATKPTGCTGEVGMWPDPLIPAVDVYVSEYWYRRW